WRRPTGERWTWSAVRAAARRSRSACTRRSRTRPAPRRRPPAASPSLPLPTPPERRGVTGAAVPRSWSVRARPDQPSHSGGGSMNDLGARRPHRLAGVLRDGAEAAGRHPARLRIRAALVVTALAMIATVGIAALPALVRHGSSGN